MTQIHVNAVKTALGAMTRQRGAHSGGTYRFLCDDLISQTRRVTHRSVGESSRSHRPLEPKLQLAYPTGCRISHFAGALSCLSPGKLKLGFESTKPPMNPNRYPHGRGTSSTGTVAKIATAPLHELFWSVPKTGVLLEEAEQRITAALRMALTPEPVQLFDDLYEGLAR